MVITYTVAKAVEASGLGARTIYRAMAEGRLASVLVGRRRLIPARALEDFLLRGAGSAAAGPGQPPNREKLTPRRLPRGRGGIRSAMGKPKLARSAA